MLAFESFGDGMITLGGDGKPEDAKTAIPSIDSLLARFDTVVAGFKQADPGEPPALKRRKVGRYVYILLENLRDLPARAEIAGEMAKKGFEVILGHTAPMSAQKFGDLPPGIMVGNGLTKTTSRVLWNSGCAGHLNVAYSDDLLYDAPDIHKYTVRLADFIFSPSDEIAGVLKNHAPANKVSTVGFPAARYERLSEEKPVICSGAELVNNTKGFERTVAEKLNSLGSQTAEDLRQRIITEREDFDRAIDGYVETQGRFLPHATENTGVYIFNGIAIDTWLNPYSALKRATKAYCPQRSIREMLFANIPAQTYGGDTEQLPEIQKSTIANDLETIWRQNQYTMKFHVEQAWSAAGEREFSREGFPEIQETEVELFAQHPVKRLDWNTWALLPHAA